MVYSQVQICNLALGRLGAKQFISSIDERSINGQRCLNIWDAIFQEVLSERDWKFAKFRAELQQSATQPLYGYKYAYALPSDFLRLVKPHRKPPVRNYYALYGEGVYPHHDLPVRPTGYPYVVEQLEDSEGGTNTYLLIDYDNGESNEPLSINYIRLITNLNLLMPGFVNCLVWRLAQELSIAVTEDKQKFQAAQSAYRDSLNSAEAQNETLDFSEDVGSQSWTAAGRFAG